MPFPLRPALTQVPDVIPRTELNEDELQQLRDWAAQNPDAFRTKINSTGVNEQSVNLLTRMYPTHTEAQLSDYFKQPEPVIPKFDVPHDILGAEGEKVGRYYGPEGKKELPLGGTGIAPYEAPTLQERISQGAKQALKLWSEETYQKYKDVPWPQVIAQQLEDPRSPLNAILFGPTLAPAKVVAEGVPLLQALKGAPKAIPEGLVGTAKTAAYAAQDIGKLAGKGLEAVGAGAERAAGAYRVTPLAGEAGFARIPGRPEITPAEIKHWIDAGNTKPTSEALAKLDKLGLIVRVEGHTGEAGLFPFSVQLKDGTFITKPTKLKEFANAEWAKPVIPQGKPLPAFSIPTTGPAISARRGRYSDLLKDVQELINERKPVDAGNKIANAYERGHISEAEADGLLRDFMNVDSVQYWRGKVKPSTFAKAEKPLTPAEQETLFAGVTREPKPIIPTEPAAAAKGVEAAKEPWGMTKEEFIAQSDIMYRGTYTEGLTKFTEPSGGEYRRVAGIYLSKDPKEALKYTKTEGIPNSKQVYTVKVHFKNPATRADLDKIPYVGVNGEQVRDILRKRGFDALIDDTMNEVVAFSPDQLEIVNHKQLIKQALSEGKPVPPEVLKAYPSLVRDYPDLAAQAKGAGGMPPIITEMMETGAKSLGELRQKVTNVRYGEPGEILFEFKGKSFKAPEPTDVMPVGHGEASQSWALKQVLDRKATEVSAQAKGVPAVEAGAMPKGAGEVKPPVTPVETLADKQATVAKLEAEHATFTEKVKAMSDKEYRPRARSLDKEDARLIDAIDEAKVAVMDAEDALKVGKTEVPPVSPIVEKPITGEVPPVKPPVPQMTESPGTALWAGALKNQEQTPYVPKRPLEIGKDAPPIKPPVPPAGEGVPPGGQPPVPGSPLSRIQTMLGTKPNKTRDWEEVGLKAQEYINDSFYGLRRLQGEIAKRQTIQPGGEKDIITAITRAPGAANAGLARYEITVASMKKLAPDANITDISTVLFAEHGKEILVAKGPTRVLPGGVNTFEGLDQALADLRLKLGDTKYQQVRSAAETVKDLYATERQRLVDSGLISKELGDALAKEYPWYNPLKYLDYVESEAAQGRTVRPISVSSSGLRRLSEVGSEKAILDPITALPQELVKNEVRIQKNDLAKGIIEVGLKDPKLGITKRSITVPVAQVEGTPIFRPQHGEIPGTISYFENGVRQVYDVPDWMYRETAVLNQFVANPVSSIIGALNGISRASFTTFSPAFTVANLFNDMLPALVRGGVLPTETARRLVLSFKTLESDSLMQAYRLSGAYQGRFYGKDAAEIAKQVGASGGKVIGKTFDLKKAILDAIPNLGEKGEQASRQAVFEKTLNKTLPGWKNMTPEEIATTPQARKAAADAVEATINFGRGGYLIRSANPFVIFLNASMEGTKLPFRTLRDSSRSRWTLAGLGAGMAGLTAYNMSYPEYFDVSSRVRWGSVVIMLPSTKTDIKGKPVPKYLTVIPNTREWATFFAPLTYGMEKAFKGNPEDFGQFAKAMVPQVSPVSNLPLPQVATEAVEQITNYDFYTGAPIISQGKANLPATEQTGPYVSSTVEKGSQAAGLSPLRVQHGLQGLFGGAGVATLSVIDLVIGAKNKRGLELQKQYAAVPVSQKAGWMNKLSAGDKSALTAATGQAQTNIPVISPVAGRFYHERGGQLEQNDWTRFDNAVKDTNKQFATINKVSELGIRLGSVGNSIDLQPDVKGGSVDLTPSQRADYQKVIADTVIPGIKSYIARTNWSGIKPDQQKELITKQVEILKKTAHTLYLSKYRTGVKTTPSNTGGYIKPTDIYGGK